MFLLQSCVKSASIFTSSLQMEALLPGTSDTIVVKHKSGKYKSTPFLACFGPYTVANKSKHVNIYINNKLIPQLKFSLDSHGYSYPMYPGEKEIEKMGLKFGKNDIMYEFGQNVLKAEVHLFTDSDKIFVSDVDGTLTKNDFGGLVGNVLDTDYLHDGYQGLIRKVQQNGYKIVWLTMRSLPLYQFSKNYIRKTVGVEGVLIMEPQQFLPALKKQVMKKTGNVKTNLMKQIRKLFSQKVNPFVGGLGNRQNDAIAYYHAGIDLNSIFIIDTKSKVHRLDMTSKSITYKQMIGQIDHYFPKYNAMKIGY